MGLNTVYGLGVIKSLWSTGLLSEEHSFTVKEISELSGPNPVRQEWRFDPQICNLFGTKTNSAIVLVHIPTSNSSKSGLQIQMLAARAI